MYDPMIGRFLQRDKVSGSVFGPQSLNRYIYVANNPMRFTDPTGLFGVDDESKKLCIDPSARYYCFGPTFHPGPGGSLLIQMGGVKNFDPFANEGAGSLGSGATDLGGGPSQRAITVLKKDLEHVLDIHSSGAKVPGKSRFFAGEDILALIRKAEDYARSKQPKGNNYETTLDAGRNIGIDRTTGQPNSIYTVITRLDDSLVTTFPGVPARVP
jgi:hypothetical protein